MRGVIGMALRAAVTGGVMRVARRTCRFSHRLEIRDKLMRVVARVAARCAVVRDTMTARAIAGLWLQHVRAMIEMR